MNIALVGEAWGKDEETEGHPFVGQSGVELARMLYESGLSKLPPPDKSFITPRQMRHWWAFTPFKLFNVLNFRPESAIIGSGNNFDALLVKKAEAAPGLPQLSQGKYLPPKYVPELEKLWAALRATKPTLILALGAKPTWALLGSSRIRALRGTPATSLYGKVLPTYHPAAVLRQWGLRPIVVKDFEKAAREASFPEIRRPEREIIVNPTLADIATWFESEGLARNPGAELSADIETKFGQVEMISFSARPELALVIPFIDQTKPDWSYWSLEDEVLAWEWVQRLVGGPWPKVGQNFLYDLQYLMRAGIRPRNCHEDTMLLHHSIYPELEKGLGFLGSIYTNEASWKLMREEETLKRDE